MGREGIISSTMSKKIAHMMFFMSVLVVYIHMYDASFTDASFRFEQALEDLISQGFCRVSVPLFFMISGYLHFSRENLSPRVLLRKIPSKIPTLVVPYLLWNSIYTIYFFGVRTLVGQLPKIDDWFSCMFRAIFLYGTHGAFWYMFQLIFLFLLSPCLYYLYRNVYIGILSCCIFFGFYLQFYEGTKLFLVPGLLFFSIGAMVSLHGRHIVDREYQNSKLKKYGPLVAILVFILLMMWRASLMNLDEDIAVLRNTIPYHLFEFAAPVTFWFCADVIPFEKIPVKRWEKESFFIYSAHGIVLSVFAIVVKRLIPRTPLMRTTVYLCGPLIIVAVTLLGAAILKKLMPKFYQGLSGGR